MAIRLRCPLLPGLRFRRSSLAVAVVLGLLGNAYAHSGRTDSRGGHFNRKTGSYHYHNSGSAGRIAPISPPAYTPPPILPKRSPPVTHRVPERSEPKTSRSSRSQPKLVPRYTVYLSSGISRPIVDYRDEGDSYWIKGVAGAGSYFPKTAIERFEPIVASAPKKEGANSEPPKAAKRVTGKVVGVTDGDTLTLLVGQAAGRARIVDL